MTFFELCRAALRDSGTGNPAGFTSVCDGLDLTRTTATEPFGQLVGWVQQAWREIQLERDDWSFRHHEFQAQVPRGVEMLQWDAMLEPGGGRSIPGNPGFQQWLFGTQPRDGWREWYAYDGDETRWPLAFVDYAYRRANSDDLNFNQTSTVPTYVSQTRDGLGVTFTPPGTDPFRLEGLYIAAPQELTRDSDVPDIPSQYHQAIVWRAVMLLHGSDEAAESYRFASMQFDQIERSMLRQFTPRPRVGGPLA